VKQIADAVEVGNRTPWDICLADATELTENHSIQNRVSLKKIFHIKLGLRYVKIFSFDSVYLTTIITLPADYVKKNKDICQLLSLTR
jgi:hypothetical protein